MTRPGPLPAADLPGYVRRDGAGGWLLSVWASPGAKKNALAGTHEGRLKVRVAAKAVEGKANAALSAFLAECLGLAGRDLELVSGQTGRKKVFRVAVGAAPDFAALEDLQGGPA